MEKQKALKRTKGKHATETKEGEKPTAKKAKLLNGTDERVETKEKEETAPRVVKIADTMNTSIFSHFKELTKPGSRRRMQAAVNLLQDLGKTTDVEKRKKEVLYTLKRLVRGCGASTNASRCGFFTALVGLLKNCTEEEVSFSSIFDTLEKELHVGAAVTDKEDADAVSGRVLVCGALIHTGRAAQANVEHLEHITNILTQATHHRTYHASLAFLFIIRLIEEVSQKQFESSIWPMLQVEIAKPWHKQTLHTVHCLIAVKNKFPVILKEQVLKDKLGSKTLLHAKSYEFLYKIFWKHSNTDTLSHPALKIFAANIAKEGKLLEFWTKSVDPGLENPTKPQELATLIIITELLSHVDINEVNVSELLSNNFMKMLIAGLQNLKLKKDNIVNAFYVEFMEALVGCCQRLTNSTQKIAVIRRLILPPGAFDIEKYTNTRVVHQLINFLDKDGVIEVFELFKSIFLDDLQKNPNNPSETWFNFERLNAGYMLQNLLAHKSVQQEYDWREKQLTFLLTCGFFHVDESLKICQKAKGSNFSRIFGEQCKKMFYTCLQSKLNDLDRERKLLLSLVQYINIQMEMKNAGKNVRAIKLEDSLQKSWHSMYVAVSADADDNKVKKKRKSNSNDKLQLVFHILLLNMSLQLFREPEMAKAAIADLLKCMERTKAQVKNKAALGKNREESQSDEPEWIEVVVDLFLHLLSQNASGLKNNVLALFPHFSSNLNLSAVHQILAVLDMKDGHNPLSAKNESEDEDDDNESSDHDSESDTQSEEGSENDDDDDVEDEDDEEEDDEDDDNNDDEDEEEDNDITETDKLRGALFQALTENKAAAADDMESVDLNDMTEEEGRQLDEALAKAFKVLKKSGGSGALNKKSKSQRAKTTNVLHFRIRVLDLIEIYLQQQPTMLISMEIMLSLFNMLEFCVGEEQKPLQQKVERVLSKLMSLKTYGVDADLKESNMVDFMRLIVEKKATGAAFEQVNKMRNKCIVFLINNLSKVATSTADNAPTLLSLCKEYLLENVQSRNPTANFTLFSEIFKLRWHGLWELSTTVARRCLSLETRSFRRIQIYELLATVYKNLELQKVDEHVTLKSFKTIAKAMCEFIEKLAIAITENADAVKHSSKEFQTLVDLLLHAHKVHVRLNLTSKLHADNVHTAVQAIRRQIRLEATNAYYRYCATFKLEKIRNNVVQQLVPVQKMNGHAAEHTSDVEHTTERPPDAKTKADKQKQKQKQKQNHIVNGGSETLKKQAQKRKQDKEQRQQRKLKKHRRMEVASEGLNNGLSFGQAVELDDETDR